jgi:HNH endonuclease
MASFDDTLSLLPSQEAALANQDLIQRYCPGLAEHTPLTIAAYITADSTECWPWPDVSEAGYGWLKLEATPYGYIQCLTTHRYMYDILVGDVPQGYHVHHRCDNKRCWNPFHLRELTPQEHYDVHHPPRVLSPLPWVPPVQLALAFGS